MDISRMSLAVAADSKEKKLYVKYCRDLNMDPSWVNKEFVNTVTNKEFVLLGLNKKGALFTVIVKDKNLPFNEVYSIKSFMEKCKLK